MTNIPREDLIEALRTLYQERDDAMRTRFSRSLPFADTILENRWDRARRLGFGEGASIYDSAQIFGRVRVGANTWIGPGALLDGSGGDGLTIGATCSISAGVHIYTHDTVLWAVSGGTAPRREGSVVIGDCCHLGAQSVIIAGITIGHRCVIAANSMVNRDVPDNTIVGGTPARTLGHVEGEGSHIRLAFHSTTSPGGSAE